MFDAETDQDCYSMTECHCLTRALLIEIVVGSYGLTLPVAVAVAAGVAGLAVDTLDIAVAADPVAAAAVADLFASLCGLEALAASGYAPVAGLPPLSPSQRTGLAGSGRSKKKCFRLIGL